MKRMIDIHRLESIKELLLAVAEGNFSYQISRTQEDDELESIVLLLNWLIEELQDSFQLLSSIQTRGHSISSIQLLFVLDEDHRIVHVNEGAEKQFDITKAQLKGKLFTTLLNKQSLTYWRSITHLISKPTPYAGACKLMFQCGPYLRKKIAFQINSFTLPQQTTRLIVLSSYQLVPKLKLIEDEIHHQMKQRNIESVAEADDSVVKKSGKNKRKPYIRKPKYMLNESDVLLAQELRDYILKHLESPLPSLQKLARQFNTNEFRLKRVFTQFYNTSIFRFYTDERLKKSSFLLQTSRLSIQKIASLCGFKNVSHFATAFKKHYTVSPSDYRKLYNPDFIPTDFKD